MCLSILMLNLCNRHIIFVTAYLFLVGILMEKKNITKWQTVATLIRLLLLPADAFLSEWSMTKVRNIYYYYQLVESMNVTEIEFLLKNMVCFYFFFLTQIHHKLFITLLLGSKAKTIVVKQPSYSQTKILRLYRRITIYGHFSI